MAINKIVVVGVSASGKSTFARKLAKKTGLPLTHMDKIMWQPGWDYVGDEVTAVEINKISQADKWIIEGYISEAARSDLFNMVDVILYLDYPSWLCVWRYLKRVWLHRKKARSELPGSPDKFSFKFMKLVWNKGEVWKLEKLLQENDWDNKIVRLKSPKQALEYLNGI